MTEFKGIDVSKWQGNIDWAKVKASGIKFAMVRSSARHTYVDDKFKANVQGCVDNNIDYGIYHVMYATTVDIAKLEAKHFLNTIKGLKPTYPVVLDLERWEENANCSGELLTDMATAFCDIVEKAGYYIAIYANKSWLTGVLNYNRLKRFDIWLAQWSDKATWTGNFGLWQYDNSGKIDGINGNVDMNISYKDYPSIIQSNSFNGYVKEVVIKPIIKPCAKSNIVKIVQSQKPIVKPVATKSTLKVGDKVIVLKAIDYDGKPFKTWFKTYTVKEINDNRIVIGIGVVVTCAINIKNIKKV